MTWLETLGARGIVFVQDFGRAGVFLFWSLVGIFRPPFKLAPIVKQVYVIGATSFTVIFFTGAFVGMVLGLQGHYTLRMFGAEGALGSAVALSLIRELGPVLTGLMVTGRVGSAICAEVGIMRISEQIDALECMAIDPYRFLISPKVVASIISLPLLTAIFNIVGLVGGFLVGVRLLGGSEGAYLATMKSAVLAADIRMCFIKSICFAILIVWISADRGFWVHKNKDGFGAEGVSRATTHAVVISSVAILLADYIITSILL
ncbi:MAG: ABC transporter permease [Deltaproteobacteria bacterium]|nr:ABC transporter permease [Candidatus Anaeroferrophillus wilburensis]MBN2888160.1 ABC transporter permease [Deltaproteobacteria bacterium]